MPPPTSITTRTFGGFHILEIRPPRVRRGLHLTVGLVLFGVALAMSVEARLGTNPWTVFAEGAADRLGISLGTTVVLTGLSLLILLRFLHEPLGLGTVLNVAIIGPVADIALWLIPDLDSLLIRIPLIAAAPIVLGLGSGLYLGAGVGPGPRDGLMTALSRRGVPTWLARTVIELGALSVGWALGGTVGLGTAWMAFSVGPWVHLFLRPLSIDHKMAAESTV